MTQNENPGAVNESAIMSRLVVALEDLWAAIAQNHPDVPPAVLTVVPGEVGVNTHYSTGRWSYGAARLAEVQVSGEALRQGARKTAITVLHTAAHGIAATREQKDTSRQGRYHNDKFGWMTSAMEDLNADVAARYAWELAALAEALEDFYRLPEKAPKEEGEEEETEDKGPVTALCQCESPRRIRVARSVFEVAGIACEACGSLFEPR